MGSLRPKEAVTLAILGWVVARGGDDVVAVVLEGRWRARVEFLRDGMLGSER